MIEVGIISGVEQDPAEGVLIGLDGHPAECLGISVVLPLDWFSFSDPSMHLEDTTAQVDECKGC